MVAHIVVVEDDRSVREMLGEVLRTDDHRVDVHGNGEQAIVDPALIDCDLLVLDLGLPGVTGLDVCRHVRRRGRSGPILMLTARAEVSDRVAGLDAGADDYLVKPFALEELRARVRALLRRAEFDDTTGGGTNSTASLGGLTIDLATREVRRDGDSISLTRLEFDLLHLLVERAPAVVDRATIHAEIWNADSDHLSNALEVCISQLRRKLEAGDRPRLIHTVRGIGYVARSEG
ncbi:MAG: response regulator transcription factor [Actinomycetota bacterium]